jgi:hypothetical protein
MNEKIRLLQAEIQADLQSIEETYKILSTIDKKRTEPEMDVVLGYYLHILYGLFENIFSRIALAFENQIADKSRWHAELLRRMTLEIEGIRPSAINPKTYQSLDELRRFRHLFRNAYLLRFDPERLALVLKEARQLKTLYPKDLEAFLLFLDTLLVDE